MSNSSLRLSLLSVLKFSTPFSILQIFPSATFLILQTSLGSHSPLTILIISLYDFLIALGPAGKFAWVALFVMWSHLRPHFPYGCHDLCEHQTARNLNKFESSKWCKWFQFSYYVSDTSPLHLIKLLELQALQQPSFPLERFTSQALQSLSTSSLPPLGLAATLFPFLWSFRRALSGQSFLDSFLLMPFEHIQRCIYKWIGLRKFTYLHSGQKKGASGFSARSLLRQLVANVCPHSGSRRGTRSPSLEYYRWQMLHVNSSKCILIFYNIFLLI